MRPALLLAVVLFSLVGLGAPPPRPLSEEDKGVGFSDIAFAAAGTFVSSADGTVRRLEGDTLPVVFDAGRKLVSLAVSEDGRQLAAVGAGVVARSSDGGRTFRVEPTPDRVMAYAIAFVRSELLLFDVKGRGFRSPRPGAGFLPLELPRATRYWTASFSGLRGFVVGQGDVLLATEDGGERWKVLTAPVSEAQAVLTVGHAVWVSGRLGVFRSDDGGQTFRQVFASRRSCTRMGARGRSVVVACSAMEHVLAYAADGEHFQEVPVPEAANMMAAGITPDGQLVAVGANELLVRATPQRGRVIATSEVARRWLEVMAQGRAKEGAREELPPEGVIYRQGERGVLTGTVRNAREVPLAGITVEIQGDPMFHGEGAQKVTTGADGRYRFKPSTKKKVRVRVNAPGHAPVSREIPISDWEETVADFLLQAEVQLAGKVLTAAGPAQGGGELRLWPLPPEEGDLKEWRATARPVGWARIQPDGTFRFQGVAAGEYLLEAAATGFRPMSQRVRAPDVAVNVRVAEGAQVRGRFHDAKGAPMVEARVRLKPMPETEQALARAGVDGRQSTQTDARGTFSLSGLADGDYELEVGSAHGKERICLRREVAVRKGKAASVELRVGQGPVIRGRLKDAQHRPLQGFKILGMFHAQPCAIRFAITGEDGSFVLQDVMAPGRYKLYAEKVGESKDGGLRSIGEAEGTRGGSEGTFVFPGTP